MYDNLRHAHVFSHATKYSRDTLHVKRQYCLLALVDTYVLFLEISSGDRMVDTLTLVHRDMKQLEHDTVAIGCSSRNLLVTLIPLISLKYLDEHVINV